MNAQTIQSNKLTKVLIILAGLINLGIIFRLFATGLKRTIQSSSNSIVRTYKSAYTFIFGGQLISEHVTYDVKGGSALGIVSFIFTIVSLLAILFALLLRKKSSKLSKILLLSSFVFLFSSSIRWCCRHTDAANILAKAIYGYPSSAVKNTIYKNTSLSFGFIGPAVFGFIDCLVILSTYFFDGTVDKIKAYLSSLI